MKKIFTLCFLAFLTITSGVNARTLSPSQALKRLSNLGSDAPALRALGSLSAPPQLLSTKYSPAGAPAVYIFSQPTSEKAVGSLLFVGADDAAAPLLGYTDNAVPEGADLPPQLQWWLDEYAREIESAAVPASPAAYAPLSSVSPKAFVDQGPIAPLVSTRWNQDAPFYDHCPKIASLRTYTGCVATCMAQIVNYFKHPAQHGTGTASATTEETKINSTTTIPEATVTCNLDTIPLDWDNMLDIYSPNGYTAQEGTAVARLMMAMGYAVGMSYGTNASGAMSQDIAAALFDHFDFDGRARLYTRTNYPLAQWQQMLYDNLKNVGPIAYGGSDPLSGGHSFVCDGYSSDG